MNALVLEGDGKYPDINFDPATGVLGLSGRCIPEDPFPFFKPIIEWLEEYFDNSPPPSTFVIHFEYFNSSSLRFVIEMFILSSAAYQDGKVQIRVNWLYDDDDDDMFTAGETCASFVKFPFDIVAVAQEE